MDLTAAAMAAGGVNVSGTTSGLTNDMALDNTSTMSCTGYATMGPDAIYKLTVSAGQTITVDAMPITAGEVGWDIAVFLLPGCAPTGCMVGADVGFAGDPETLTYSVTTAGTYLLVVDSYLDTNYGCYDLNVSIH